MRHCSLEIEYELIINATNEIKHDLIDKSFKRSSKDGTENDYLFSDKS